MKTCYHCKTEKPFSEFHKDRSRKDGYGNECKICSSERGKEQYQKNKEKILEMCRDARLKRQYGIDVNEYNKLLEEQNGKCAICGSEECTSGKNFAIDHNHQTGEVRGLLCRACNLALGHLQDSPRLVKNAYQYLIDKGHYGKGEI
jgi:hypothetical protein